VALQVEARPRREQTRARRPDAEGFVERDGVRVFYEVHGTGAPTILLLPTWSIVHSRVWKLQVPYLARHARVVTFDGRGNGRSDRPAEPAAYDEREFAADAVAVLDATGTSRAIAVGLSAGAHRGTILAAEHPERVAGVVYIAPAWPGGGELLPAQVGYEWGRATSPREGWALFSRDAWLAEYPRFLEFFFSQVFTEPHSTKQVEDCVGWGLETSGETLVTGHLAPALRPEDARSLAARIRCPVLVIHGAQDAVVSVTRGMALAEQTGGELVVLEGAGHCPQARDPVRVNVLLREFVERVARQG
jgi:pimeloyl-ACP methyl ester carboxylesterase